MSKKEKKKEKKSFSFYLNKIPNWVWELVKQVFWVIVREKIKEVIKKLFLEFDLYL